MAESALSRYVVAVAAGVTVLALAGLAAWLWPDIKTFQVTMGIWGVLLLLIIGVLVYEAILSLVKLRRDMRAAKPRPAKAVPEVADNNRGLTLRQLSDEVDGAPPYSREQRAASFV